MNGWIITISLINSLCTLNADDECSEIREHTVHCKIKKYKYTQDAIWGSSDVHTSRALWRISSLAIKIHERPSFCTEYVRSALALSRFIEFTATRLLLCPSWKWVYGPFICILNYSSCDCTSLALVKWGAKCVKNSHEGISLAWREKEREEG